MTFPVSRYKGPHRVYPAEPQPRPRRNWRLEMWIVGVGLALAIYGWEQLYEWATLALMWGWTILWVWVVICVLALLSLQTVGRWLGRLSSK